MRTLFCFAFCLLMAIHYPAHAAEEKPASDGAPFGLSWGMSTAEVKALGVELSDFPGKDWGSSFRATNLPKVIADAETVVLSFGFDDKLWRIVAISRPFENDPSGGATLARYDELNKILTEKYGKGHSVQRVDQYSDQKYFLMHIQGGQSVWFTDYDTADLTIQLGIGATDLSTGFWRLIFTQKALEADFKKAKSSGEKGAL